MSQNEADRKLCEEGQKIAAKASDGKDGVLPWEVRYGVVAMPYPGGGREIIFSGGSGTRPNMEFVADARTRVPALASRLLARVAEAEEKDKLLERVLAGPLVQCKPGSPCPSCPLRDAIRKALGWT